MGVTILVIGLAWYQKLKHNNQNDCNCKTAEKTNITQSKMFLGLMTVFAVIMLAFPYFSNIFYPKTEKQIIIIDKSYIQKAKFTVKGMTCADCEEHINYEINKLPGIIGSNASYKSGKAEIEFDESQIDINEIEKAINSTGYYVIDRKEN